VGLLLLAAACSAPELPAVPELTGDTQTAGEPIELAPTSTESTPAETPTARLVVTPAETEAVQGETPSTGADTQPAEVEVTPTRTPAATAEAKAQTPATGEADADLGPTEEQVRLLAELESYGPAPELHNDVWLNSEPLSLADLRGQVVMVEFWTFG
jgi:hypothetical protein